MFKVVKNTRRNRRSVSPTTAAAAATRHATPTGTLDTAMNSFFNAESASAFLKPWLRLERGLRLQRFRAFAEEYPDLTAEERDILNRTLVKANDAKILNTKQQIQYEEGKIVGIRGLRMVRGESGPATFKIDAAATARPTKRKLHKEDSEEGKEGKEVKKIEGVSE